MDAIFLGCATVCVVLTAFLTIRGREQDLVFAWFYAFLGWAVAILNILNKIIEVG